MKLVRKFDDLVYLIWKEDERSSEDWIFLLVALEDKCSDNTEVCTSTSDSPEEVRVLGFRGGDSFAGCEDDLNGDQNICACLSEKTMLKDNRALTNYQPVLPAEIPVTATKRETTDTGMVNRTANSRKSKLSSFNVNIFPERSPFSLDCLHFWVDSHLTHLREVDDETICDGGSTRCRMSATTNGKWDLVLANER